MHDVEGAALFSLEAIPLLPRARSRWVIARSIGIIMITCTLLLYVGHSVCFSYSPPLALGRVLFALGWVETAAAMVSLVGLYCADPGEIGRDATMPVPPAVAAAISSGQPVERNVESPELGSFCVRCFVWRAHAAPEVHARRCQPRQLIVRPFDHGGRAAHHCSTCHRCVTDFSHHCGFFGICIAGRGWRGNYKYFRAVLSIAPAAALTLATALFARAWYAWDARFGIVFPVPQFAALLATLLLMLCVAPLLVLGACAFVVRRHCFPAWARYREGDVGEKRSL
jgi:hypothetical protein